VAKNVMQQRIATQQGISAEKQQFGEQGVEQSKKGIAFAASIPAAELGASEAFLGPGASAATKAFYSGGLGGGSYEALKSAMAGKSASDIYNDMSHGIAAGSISGPVLHGVGKAIGSTAGKVLGPIAEQAAGAMGIETPAARKLTELQAARILQARQTGVGEFANKFQPYWLGTRFSDMDLTPDPEGARTLIARVMGADAAAQAPPDALTSLAKKIEFYQNKANIDPSLRSAVDYGPQPTTPVPGLQPSGAPMEGAGGLAPEPQPQALGGALGDQTTFTPPQGVAPSPDLAGAESVAAPLPELQLEPTAPPASTPEMQQPFTGPTAESGAGAMMKPLGVFSGSPVDPNTVNLEPSPVLQRKLPNEIQGLGSPKLGQPSGRPGPKYEPHTLGSTSEKPVATAEKLGVKVGKQAPEKKLLPEELANKKMTLLRDLKKLSDKQFSYAWHYTKDEVRNMLGQ